MTDPNDLLCLRLTLAPGGFRVRLHRNPAYSAVMTLDQAQAALAKLKKQARLQGLAAREEFTLEVEEAAGEGP